ncbi:septation protein A [uncultured Sutterella sp.]|uniref:septation protein A n=1 Tax=uncultured Sutterella sp. TaxID=286133 RepID=UPI0025D5A212|nr:septation protein A [uncultured Sutterella sp.]
MKLLFDLFPVILFFAAFKGAEHFPADALALAERLLGDGVTATTAPVFLATVTAIAATFLQIGWLKMKRAKIEPMLWISLAVIVVFGGLTLWLRNEMFIKWKPTILYWIFSSILLWGSFTGRNFIRILMKNAVEMPDAAWSKLQTMWIVFFIVVGVLNLIVAYSFPTEIWVNFKLFGLISLTLIFTIGAAVWMTKQSTPRQN